MTSGIEGPWQNQPTFCWLGLAVSQTKPCGMKGLIRRRWSRRGELEAAF
jgi:hypothetical protein